MNTHTYIAYIDGSHHYKSQTSGWGFVIEKNGAIYESAFGQVPDEWKMCFENYAFAKLIEFCLKNEIENIHIKTDYLNLQKRLKYASSFEILEEAKKYLPQLSSEGKVLHATFEHVSRKHNKIADKVSREYLVNLLKEERVIFEKEFNNNKVNGNFKHPKINFFKTNKLIFCAKSMSRSAERKVLLAVKCDYLIIEVNQYKKDTQNFIKVMEFKNRRYIVLEEVLTTQENEKNKLMDVLEKYSMQFKLILLSIGTEKKELYDHIIGFNPDQNNVEFNLRFADLLNKIEDLFVYEKGFTRTEKENKPKLKNQIKLLTLKDKITFYKSKAKTNHKALQKVIGWNILEFKKQNQREPNNDERELIKQNVLLTLENNYE